MQIGQVSEAFVEIEAVTDEELVRNGEADVAHRQVLDQAAVRAVEQRDDRERRRRAERQRLAEVVEREPGVDDVLDDQDVSSRKLRVEIFEQADPRVAAAVGAGRVARELEEIETVRNPKRAREVGDEDEARLQRRNEKRLATLVVASDLTAELADTRLQLLAREVDLAEAGAAAYEASSSRYRSARRSMSRL